MYFIEVKKIKLTFAVFFFLVIGSFSFSIVAQENANDKNIFSDIDQDGLSDANELKYGTDPKNPDSDGDGYNDGAEIKSGYNPLKAAPGDKLSTNPSTSLTLNDTTNPSGNLTTDLSAKIAAAVSESKKNGKEGLSINDINQLIDESIANNAAPISALPEIDESTIKIKVQDYSGFGKEKQARKYLEDNQEYLSAVFFIMANNLPHSIDSRESITAFSDELIKKIPTAISGENNSDISYFTELARKGEDISKELAKLEVPKDMLELHKEGLQLGLYSISLKDKVKLDNTDPIASLVSFSEVENAMVLANDYLTKVQTKLEELGLTDFALEESTKYE
ncbi:MAG: hypothetical protein WAV16_00870 [Candidatus Moraniibacteriota bacterium]